MLHNNAGIAISDAHPCVLQNSDLSVIIMAAEGGRVASLRSLRSGHMSAGVKIGHGAPRERGFAAE